MQLEWWAWIVIGIVLIVAELAIPSFFTIWFGLGALLVGLLMLALPDLSVTAQLAIWTAASLAMVALWFRVFKPGFHKTRVGTAAGEAIGEIGLLVSAVAPFQRGKVRFQRPVLGSDEWVCVADGAIAAGERVKVVSVEGSFLTVSKI
ncbi:NfeD family protein [Dechloromonas sp. XY25]|uniref:NfeD family protein n=1 Tax=Dechloromonas hankyongensis TaxID=2908002 RepID=A0ABS9JYV1_9RHOO|nr:NfeD family protein [Dechloromonas hankyongensis]MCG2576095.1 NfeD family protein [Dechloromonas hankyongensis]